MGLLSDISGQVVSGSVQVPHGIVLSDISGARL